MRGNFPDGRNRNPAICRYSNGNPNTGDQSTKGRQPIMSKGKRLLTRAWRRLTKKTGELGQAVVEMALVLPIFVILLTGAPCADGHEEAAVATA
jgi:hypothetical protein